MPYWHDCMRSYPRRHEILSVNRESRGHGPVTSRVKSATGLARACGQYLADVPLAENLERMGMYKNGLQGPGKSNVLSSVFLRWPELTSHRNSLQHNTSHVGNHSLSASSLRRVHPTLSASSPRRTTTPTPANLSFPLDSRHEGHHSPCRLHVLGLRRRQPPSSGLSRQASGCHLAPRFCWRAQLDQPRSHTCRRRRSKTCQTPSRGHLRRSPFQHP